MTIDRIYFISRAACHQFIVKMGYLDASTINICKDVYKMFASVDRSLVNTPSVMGMLNNYSHMIVPEPLTQEDIEWAASNDWMVAECGFLIEETKKYLVFAGRKGDYQEDNVPKFGSIMKIPKTWVRKRVDLTEHTE